MIGIFTNTPGNTNMTDRSVVATCLLGSRLRGTGVSGGPVSDERPIQAPAVAAEAQAQAYAFTAAAVGAGAGRQTETKKQHTMWAFRGLEPWRDPA
ncbi:hypothetical protein V1J52_05695 [Streptomyces sp. TRM 70351]|uniref:hypothetical protein n=1 Tax=Streptomyces sp. TRM 70351 TaxID=3116552 RepID=UPI002E7B837F|nr:hypothetical protein [Streptomyces sp. TRM 70351]MEE1927687.1 hypothetical protein [Streptomyces sp. TRM 70351]